jgi:hypothetical protein
VKLPPAFLSVVLWLLPTPDMSALETILTEDERELLEAAQQGDVEIVDELLDQVMVNRLVANEVDALQC